MSTGKPLRVAVLGAGGRGQGFGKLLAASPHLAEVVAVAEPRDAYREKFAATHNLSPGRTFRSWQDFVARPPDCDAVVVSTMDRDHAGPAVACLNLGLHMLLEKPMAATLEECRAIEAAQRRAGVLVAVCHSMRYQKGFARLHALVASGRISEIVSLDQLEPVCYWHQARAPERILTSAQESLRTHTIVFAAERARRERRVERHGGVGGNFQPASSGQGLRLWPHAQLARRDARERRATDQSAANQLSVSCRPSERLGALLAGPRRRGI